MIYGPLGILGAAVVFAFVGFYLCIEARRTMRDANRAVERAQAQLLPVIAAQSDRLMHLAGSTWTVPPSWANDVKEQEPEEDYMAVPDIDVRPEDSLDDSVAGLDPL